MVTQYIQNLMFFALEFQYTEKETLFIPLKVSNFFNDKLSKGLSLQSLTALPPVKVLTYL